MVLFKINDREFYIDGRLKEGLDKKVIPALKVKDEDCVFVVDGDERAGKSVFAMLLGGYCASQLGTPFGLDNVCLNPTEFRNRVMNSSKNDVVIFDEAHRGMASARSLSEVNNILKDLMMEMGQKNLLIIVVLPSYFLLDRYAALFRSKGLFHIYKRKEQRGFWCFFNRKYKLKLYQKGKKDLNYNCMRWPYFRGRFYNQFVIEEALYRGKKAKSFTDKPRVTKGEVWMLQRDKLIFLIHKKFGLGAPSIETLLKEFDIPLKKSQIGEIFAKMRDTYDDSSPTPTH
jgi:hypothetical protein